MLSRTIIVKDNACTPSIPAGLKCPPPYKTISLITCVGAYLNNRNVENEGDSDGRRKIVEKRLLVQFILIQYT